MGWTTDGHLDPDEALRLLDLLSGESGNDFVMKVETMGDIIKGESERVFEDRKPRMDIGGYLFLLEVETPPGSTKGRMRESQFVVVRDCDAATASIASLLRNQNSDLQVTVSVFKAGGDLTKEMLPHLEFQLWDARVTAQSILTGGRPKRPCEIIRFDYEAMEIRSAPQKDTGQRGAVRTCSINKK